MKTISKATGDTGEGAMLWVRGSLRIGTKLNLQHKMRYSRDRLNLEFRALGSWARLFGVRIRVGEKAA